MPANPGPLTPAEVANIRKAFKGFDTDESGKIDSMELGRLLRSLKLDADPASIRRIMSEIDTNQDGEIDVDEFIAAVRRMRQDTGSKQVSKVIRQVDRVHIQETGTSRHTYAEEERIAFCAHINSTLRDDPDLADHLPINPGSEDLFSAVTDGILLCKLINSAVKDTIDVRAINRPRKGRPFNPFKIQENLNLVINAARSIGCNVVNIGSQDLKRGPEVPHLVLGLLWQVIRIGLLTPINVKSHPGLVRLLKPDEDLHTLLRLPPQAILLRWVNFQLEEAGWERRAHNLTSDIKDSEIYTVLLSQIGKAHGCTRGPLKEANMLQRAELVLCEADKLGCRQFVRPADIVSGHAKLNLAFVCTLFNTHPALEPLEDASLAELTQLDDDESQSREARTYTRWLNSLGLETPINSIFDDAQDGLQLLRAMDLLKPGTVEWKRVEIQPNNVFKQCSNCSLVVAYGRKEFGFSLVGIGGRDIQSKNTLLVFSLLWQMMRYASVRLLSSIGKGKSVSDADILRWANAKLEGGPYAQYTITNFTAPCVATGHFFAGLIDTCKPESIDWDCLSDGTDLEARQANAKYVLSRARAIGANVYALWEDIAGNSDDPPTKPNPKACLLMTAALWVTSIIP